MFKTYKKIITICLLVALLCVTGVSVFGLLHKDNKISSESSKQNANDENKYNTNSEVDVQSEDDECGIDLGNDLVISSIESYSGQYYEDGTDEDVENIVAIEVTNNGTRELQYCEISISGENCEANFSLSTLKPKEKVLVLENTKKEFTDKNDYVVGSAQNVIFFDDATSVYSEVFHVQGLDGALNITNKSEKDITSDVYIYYKNYIDGKYYGGITYRTKVSGGLKAGELRQVIAGHFLSDSSKIVFLDIVGQ